METFFEILKITMPALIVSITVYVLLKEFLTKEQQIRTLALQRDQSKTTLPLRLQAYERISLLCERISLPNLILRIRSHSTTSGGLQMALLVAMQQEYEHNITQQIYVSPQLWEIVNMAKNQNSHIINIASKDIDPKAQVDEYIQAIFKIVEETENAFINQALLAVKTEASAIIR